jgi:hypothetical protein
MTNLNSENADVEFERYIDAYNLSQASLPIDNVLNKQKRFNPVSGRNDVVFRMGNGGYIKIGEEDLPPPLQPVVDETLAQPPQIMTEGMQQPEVATELPVSDIEIQGAQQFNEEQRRIGNIPTLEDFDAAGYSKEVVEAAGFGQPEIIKPLTQEEIQQRLETGGIEIATTDPTIRESAANAMSRYLTDIALQNLREELQAQGANERTIQETLRTRENELFGEAEVITNAIWGHKSGVGVADFATAGILDIQEGYRLYEQSLYTGNNTDRVFGLLLMAAGVGGLGSVAKAVKSKLPAIRERLNQPGPMPTTSMFGAGEIDRGLAAAGRLADGKKPSADELRRQANIQRFGYDPNEAPVDTSYRMEHQPTGPEGGEGIRLDDLTKNISGEQAGYPEDFYTPRGASLYAQGPSFPDDEYGMANQESYKIITSVRNNPDAEVTIYRAVPDEDAITTINPGDFVTLSPTYAKLHGASGYGRSGDEAGKVLEQKVKVRDIYWDGNDVNEFGYFPESSTATQSLPDMLEQKYPNVTLDISGDPERGYELSRIVIPEGERGEGMGTEVMQDMIDMADEQGARISLTPDVSFGGTSVARLKKFYKQFGFVENKGKNKDFSIRNTMYRNPQSTGGAD